MCRFLHQWKICKEAFCRWSITLFILSVFLGCQTQATLPDNHNPVLSPDPEAVYIDRGDRSSAILQFTDYHPDKARELILQFTREEAVKAIKTQNDFLNRAKLQNRKIVDSVTLTQKELRRTTERLSKVLQENFYITDSVIKDHFDLYRLSGDDSLGNVLFTGYFTPVLKVKSKRDSIYKFPFYKFPGYRGSRILPERSEIDFENVLGNRNLEIAWSANLFDNFTLQVQGSGIVEFEDQSKKILAYGGKNGHPYSSIGKYLIDLGEIAKEKISLSAIRDWLAANPDRQQEVLSINKSYVFFKLLEPIPIGAASVPLTADYSVAVDTDIIPLGSTLLAEVPILNDDGSFSHHEFRLLFAQDRGGAIKGTGRIDLYCGVGNRGIRQANSLNHYGRVWLLKAK